MNEVKCKIDKIATDKQKDGRVDPFIDEKAEPQG